MQAAHGHLHSWEDLPGMVRLYFKIPQLDLVRAENFKVRYRQNHVTVTVTWPTHLKQSVDVGPFAETVDPKSIVVSRKGEQVVVSMAKQVKQKWEALTKATTGFKEIRIDHLHRTGQGNQAKDTREVPRDDSDSNKKRPASKGKLLSDYNHTGILGKVRNLNSNKTNKAKISSKISPSRPKLDDSSSHDGIEVESYHQYHRTPEKERAGPNEELRTPKNNTAESSSGKSKPLFSRRMTLGDIGKKQVDSNLKQKPSKSNLLPLKLIDSGKKTTNLQEKRSHSQSRPRLSQSPSGKKLTSHSKMVLQDISKPNDHKKITSASSKRVGSIEKIPRSEKKSNHVKFLGENGALTERIRSSPRGYDNRKLTSLQKSLERVSRELKKSVDKSDKTKKNTAKVQITETTQDFSSSNRAGEPLVSRISNIGIDTSLKRRLEKYEAISHLEKVQLQVDLIASLASILKSERARRLACEQEFESILMKDSRKIDELVASLHPGSKSRVLAEIMRLIILFNKLRYLGQAGKALN